MVVSLCLQTAQLFALLKSRPGVDAPALTKQQQEELPHLERVAAANRIAVTLLMNAAVAAAAASADAAASPQFKPQWEFGQHKLFPTLVLKSAGAASKSLSASTRSAGL